VDLFDFDVELEVRKHLPSFPHWHCVCYDIRKVVSLETKVRSIGEKGAMLRSYERIVILCRTSADT